MQQIDRSGQAAGLGSREGHSVTTCAIRYRFDGPGPSSFIVQCGDERRVYCRGMLSGPISDEQVTGMLAGRRSRWVAASGELMLPSDVRGWPSLLPPGIDTNATESA
jgi:hypothetical protein